MARTHRLLARLEALTDGVYAIVMTLLVFGIAVPTTALIASEDDLGNALQSLLIPLAGYALSFLILTSYWLGHTVQLELLVRSTRGHAHVNGLVLLSVSLIPFSAAVLDRFYELPLALQVYGANLVLAQLALALHWWYVARYNHLVKGTVTPERIRATSRRLWVGVALDGAGVLLAFVWPLGAALVYFGVYLYYVVEHLRHRVK
jgi:uncharacterized membrane protein